MPSSRNFCFTKNSFLSLNLFEEKPSLNNNNDTNNIYLLHVQGTVLSALYVLIYLIFMRTHEFSTIKIPIYG